LKLPEEIRKLLTDVKVKVKDNSKGELILPLRKNILLQLGDFEVSKYGKASFTLGLKRRLKLASLCVRKVVEKWSDTLKVNEKPMQMLSLAQDYLAGKIDKRIIIYQIGAYSSEIDNMGEGENDGLLTSLGYASIATADIAVRDVHLMVRSKPDASDDDFDFYDWDAYYWSSLAFAGNNPWIEEAIETKREFWLWFLEEAVPEAFIM
jgi:hypothetical protein